MFARSRASCAAPAITRPRSAPRATASARSAPVTSVIAVSADRRRLPLQRAVPVAGEEDPLDDDLPGDLRLDRGDVGQRRGDVRVLAGGPGERRRRVPERGGVERGEHRRCRRRRRSGRPAAGRRASRRPCRRSPRRRAWPGRPRAAGAPGRSARPGHRPRRRRPGPPGRRRRSRPIRRATGSGRTGRTCRTLMALRSHVVSLPGGYRSRARRVEPSAASWYLAIVQSRSDSRLR